MIEVRDVWKTLGGREILRGMSFTVPKGKTYVLMGRSGIGKSVTLKHVIGILKPDRGTIVVDDKEVPQLDAAGLRQLRTRMGYLFQNGALINWLTVAENVALPLVEHGQRGVSQKLTKADIHARVIEVLRLVDMEQAADLLPERISGGMRLRTGLARALVTKPEYVLYDEPNAGLDPIICKQIHRLLVEVRDKLGVTGLVVTHSRALAFDVADWIGVIDEGRIGAEGPVEAMRACATPLVHAFLGSGTD